MKGLSNLFYNYDIHIIVFCAIINAAIFAATILQIRNVRKVLHPKSSLRFRTKVNSQITGEEAQRISTLKSILLFFYSSYANITAIFPLLGILGTVAALIKLSPNGSEDMMQNLMVALETTLLGAFFAVLYKFFDSLLSGPIEEICDDVDFVIRNYDETLEEKKSSEEAKKTIEVDKKPSKESKTPIIEKPPIVVENPTEVTDTTIEEKECDQDA